MKTESAASLMENYITSGGYREKKQVELHLKGDKKKGILGAQDQLRHCLKDHDSKRFEYVDLNLVAKFVTKRVYNWDYESLHEYLDDLGLFPLVAKIDNKALKDDLATMDMLEDFRLPSTYYIKPSLNKLGKAVVEVSAAEFRSLGEGELLKTIKNLKVLYERQTQIYEDLKSGMMQCDILQSEKKVEHEYGSVSLIENTQEYDMMEIYQHFGSDFLLKYSKVDNSLLDSYVFQGTIKSSEIEQFRTLHDVRLDFVVMALDVEQKILAQQQKRRILTSLNLEKKRA
ncbi:hypothetical protein ACFSCX_06455 [Bacillus salitolerans]|uniref:Uncharacterized protein n=1 Tax=Bacillus salitolerans TaxID=1437434 RepID=A0ABW4LM35_9BACI